LNSRAACKARIGRHLLYPDPWYHFGRQLSPKRWPVRGLQQGFNSLDAQREAGEAFIVSQKGEGFLALTDHYDDGGYTGGNMDRPALQRLLAAVESRSVDCVVVYKVDRLSRSLMDFARIVEVFDQNGVSFVSLQLR
jgi:site-specific DNA recombinase